MTVARAEFVRVGREWLDAPTPWRHQGYIKGLGADCLGMLTGINYECGLGDVRPAARNQEYRGYGRQPAPTLLEGACAKYMDPIPVSQATLADVLQLFVPHAVYPQHFALVSRVDEAGKPTHIIHATSAFPRRVTENGLNAEWWGRVSNAYHIRGVA